MRQFHRFGVPFHWPKSHPQKSLTAMRLLTSVDDNNRPKLSHAFFKAYWVDDQDITDIAVLYKITKEVGIEVAKDLISNPSEETKEKLTSNTEEVVQRGGFGVPSFWVDNAQRLFFGSDRLHFVEKALGFEHAATPRFYTSPKLFGARPTLSFYYDFSSPWAYLGSTQIERIAKECNAQLEYVPILLGALFKEIGTANIPLLTLGEAKRAWTTQDMNDWKSWWNVELNWPTQFPIRSVNALRIAIVDPKTIPTLYRAAWVLNKNIGDDAVLQNVLNEAGFNGQKLLKAAQENDIKDKLKDNTTRAITAGVCGAPSFQINGGDVIWGQDRLDVVADILCGWVPPSLEVISTGTTTRSKL